MSEETQMVQVKSSEASEVIDRTDLPPMHPTSVLRARGLLPRMPQGCTPEPKRP